ncbi:single-stranded DNA-binding protein [Pseudonocardia xinjiangensis]|uniref:Single-stranded DNA-binding protein n=1 Tax=Pseudonocardia xinjiangensis TaxID=75289 RepID=A0ABX1R5K2_9PSEU|nr:single-stranded DNA-binding protein [Pseudonocardia xinjiangensis]NMH75673.1 single-stranded DNA-binding protein [Pseudonocardia xinjiangensis]
MNEITIHGNLTANPELRYSAGGVPVLTLTVAVNRSRYDRRSGGYTNLPPVFHRVVAFNQLAENAAASLIKGATVAITGQLADDSYLKDGERRRGVKLEAAEIAASLRYATAEITRNKRPDTDTGPAPEPLPESTTEDTAA